MSTYVSTPLTYFVRPQKLVRQSGEDFKMFLIKECERYSKLSEITRGGTETRKQLTK
jgi:hypothetical protein